MDFSRSISNLIDYQRAFAVLIFLLPLLSKVSTLKCYQCVEGQPKTNESHLSCFYFDESHKFHKECTRSTYCMKKTSHYQLHNGSYIKISVHKCADQSHRTMVQDKEGDWRWTNLIMSDIYKRGCYSHGISSMLTNDAVNCFCETDLCNTASSIQSMFNLRIVVALAFLTSIFISFTSSHLSCLNV